MGKKRKSGTVADVPAKRSRFSEAGSSTQPKVKGLASPLPNVPVDESEKSFPRGGQETLTPLERRVVRERAREDVLFTEGANHGPSMEGVEEEGGEGREKRGKRKGKPLSVVSAKKPAVRLVNILNTRKLTPGVLVLGAVRAISKYEVALSLPFRMRGYVAISDVSDIITRLVESEAQREEEERGGGGGESNIPSLERLFTVGALLSCCVTEVVGGRVSLSVNPRLVNSRLTPRDVQPGIVLSGWVRSVEDHGYIIDFGVEGKSGFLLKRNASDFIRTCNKGKSLCQGQVVQCLVLPGADARSIPVSINPSSVSAALIPGETLVPFHALLPGLLVNIAVKEVTSSSLVVSFLGGFEGSVGLDHLPAGGYPSKMELYQPRKKFRARVLWVNVGNKTVGLTLQKHVVAGHSFEFPDMEIGDIFQAAKVVYSDNFYGLLLELGNGVCGYAHPGLIYDKKRDSLGKEYHKDTHHSCRVIQFNLIDGVAIVSLQPSVLEKPYMKYSDIKIGDTVDGKVERHGDFGAIISLTDTIRGLCPKIHMSDTQLKQPRRKLKEGAKVKCRVLTVTPERRQLLLTCKKSMVSSTGGLLYEYSQAKIGEVYPGVISTVKHNGCLVHFFGNVKGFVFKPELSATQVIDNPRLVFWEGQPVECRVLSCDPASEKLQLSLKLDALVAVEVSQEAALCPGQCVDLEVTGIASNGISLRYPLTGELAFLPTMHLSDYSHLCPQLLSQHQTRLEAALRTGGPYSLSGVLVVCGKLSLRPALVSLKSSLLHCARKEGLVSSFSQLKAGQLLTGFVKKRMPYGYFVEFPHNLCGLAPLKYLADQFISDTTGLYQEMQSVHAKVLEVDESSERFLLSLRPSDLRLSHRMAEKEVVGRLMTSLQGYLEERDAVLQALSITTGPVHQMSAAMAQQFHPGRRVKAQVTRVKEDTVFLELPEGVPGIATTHTAQGIAMETGSEVECCMLDVDFGEGNVVVSLNPSLVEVCRVEEKEEGRRGKKGKKIRQTIFQLSSSLTATVEYKAPHYLLCSCATIAGPRLAYGLMDTGQMGMLPPNLKFLKLGQKVSTVVHSLTSQFKGSQSGLPVVMVTGTPATDRKLLGVPTKSLAAATYDVKVGDIISVTVADVKTTYVYVKYHLWRGRIHCCLANDNVEEGSSAFPDINSGDVVRARVVGIRERPVRGKGSKIGATIEELELTTKPSLLDPSVEIDERVLLKKVFSAGENVLGFIASVGVKGLHVYLSPRARGFVPLVMASKEIKALKHLAHYFVEGEAVRCTVVEYTKKGTDAHRLSLIGPPEVLSVGDIVPGCVQKVIPGQGAVVAIPHRLGRIDITDISDHYQDDPLKVLRGKHIGVLRYCVVSVQGERIDLSLRPSRLAQGTSEPDDSHNETEEEEEEEEEERGEGSGSPRDPEIVSLEDVPEGKVVRGYVKAVTDKGAYVRLGRLVDGRVKITNLVDGYVKEFKSLFSVGQLVRAKVLKVDPVDKKVELSLRLSQVDPEAARELRKKREEEEKEGEEGEERRKAIGRRKKTRVAETSDGESVELSSEEEAESDVEISSEEEEEGEGEVMPTGRERERPSLQLRGGFHWEATPLSRGERSSSESEEEKEEEEEPPSKKSRRQKKAAQKAEEAQLFSTEQALLDSGRAPETAEDFDRLLVAHPNSSALWIQYMAFFLHTAEVDRARSIAQRALNTISFREEGEKLNVWVALMNLENLYGSQDSLVKVFDSALQQNEPIEVFFRLAAIYEQSKKFELAEQLYQTMTKRFSSNMRVWMQFGQFLMRRGKLEAARKLLQKSLKSLSLKHEHVDVISKFAQYEFRYGEPERGRTMFESLLSSYPKRVDLWSVYIDMVTKLGEPGRVREIFERAVHLKTSAKKMKFIFKRYLDFERKHGTPAGMEAVKEKARAYVETKTRE